MHVSDENLKVLIDVLAERLDDDLDMLSDSNFMEDRESVKMTWVVKDLLEELRQEQRSRGRAPAEAANSVVGVVQATMGDHEAVLRDQQDQLNDVRSALVKLLEKVKRVEALVSDHEESRMEHHARLEDHHARLKGRDPDVMFWGRIRRFEMRMEAQLMGLGGLLRALEEKLQALEVQSDDRWVRTQKAGQALSRQVETLHLVMEGHVGETGTKH